MADFPSLPLWTDAYLADTRSLSTFQHGAYLLLLMSAWRRPHTDLPDDDEELSKLAGVSPQEWALLKDKVMSFWDINQRSKTWTQKRLTQEKNYVQKNSKKQRSNAKARWDKEKSSSHGIAKTIPEECQTDAPTPTPTPTPTPIITSNDVIEPQSSSRKRGTRIMDDFKPDASCSNLADELGLTNEQRKSAIGNFIDYWKAVPGQKGMKLDWQATFRNQIRFIAKKGEINGSGNKPTRTSDYELLHQANYGTDNESDVEARRP